MNLEFSWEICKKYSHIKLHRNLSGGKQVVPCEKGEKDGWTDKKDEANNHFSQFCIVSKNGNSICQHIYSIVDAYSILKWYAMLNDKHIFTNSESRTSHKLNLQQLHSDNLKYHTFKVYLLVVQNNLQLLTSYKHNTTGNTFLVDFCRYDIDVLCKITYLGNLFAGLLSQC